MKIETLDTKLLLTFLNEINTDDFLKIDPSENNSHFFGNLMNANTVLRNLIPEECQNLNIYPPNLAIVDFFLKNFSEKKDNITLYDYGCGIPALIYFLNYCGFKNVYGYDNWTQVRKELAYEFCENSGIELNKIISFDEIIKNEEEITENKITCVSHVGYLIIPEDFKKISEMPNIKYILSDYRFTPMPSEAKGLELLSFENKAIKIENKLKNNSDSFIKELGFYPHTIYNGLLVIYEKR